MRKINAKLLLGLLIGTLVATGAVFGVHHFQYGRIADSLLWQARRAEEQGQVRRQARYLQRYLEFNRKDLAVKAELAKLWAGDTFAGSPRERYRAMRLLDDVLTNGEDNAELRRLLVKLALEMQQNKEARENLEKLLTKNFLDVPLTPSAPSEQNRDPVRGEVVGYAGQLFEAENQADKALRCYTLAIHHAPQIHSNYLNLALLKRKLDLLDPQESKKNQDQADQAINDLVKNNRTSWEAYLTRWRYRRDFDLINLSSNDEAPGVKLKDAANDVEQALARAPESVEVLLAAADLERLEAQAALASKDKTKDKEKERRAHRDKALAFLEQGLKLHAQKGKAATLDLTQFRLLWHKTNLLLDDIEQVDLRNAAEGATKNSDERKAWVAEAGQAIEQIRKTRGAPAAADFLKARLLLQDRRWAEAVTLFEQVRPTLGTQLGLAGQINRYLGQCYEQLIEPGQMFKAYQRLSDTDPNSVAAQLGMAQAEWMMGHLDKAAQIFDNLQVNKQMPAKVWLDYARLEIQRRAQMENPKWAEVELLLETAEKANRDSVDVPLVKAQLFLVQNEKDQARTLLREAQARDAWKNSVELWIARLFVEMRDNKMAEARKLLTEAKRKLGERVVLLRLAEAQLLAQEKGNGYEAAINRLGDDAEQFKEEDQAQLLGGLADIQIGKDNIASARQLWQRVATLPSRKTDLPLHLLLFDLANRAEDEAGMRQALEEIRALEGNQGPFHRYGEALRLIAHAKKQKGEPQQKLLEEARAHLDRVQSIRPNWPPLSLARAQVERLAERKDLAISNLEQAVRDGETSPAAIRNLVELLLDAGRLEEAQEYVSKLREPLLVQSDLGRIAAFLAVQTNNKKRAEDLFNKNRPGKDSNNYRELLWEGRMLAETNSPEEAGKKFRAAITKAPKEPEPYLTLVQFLVRQKRNKDADAVLEEARKNLPPQVVELTLGRCFELLGKKKSAQAHYEEALSGDRQNAAVVRDTARFYWNAGQMTEAEPLLRDLVEQRVKDASPDDVLWAKRHLALVLASGTDYGRFREALGLVGLKLDDKGHLVRDAERERVEATDTRRFQARVLAAQGGHRQFRKRAFELLEELERKRSLPPDDRFILAMLYETEGDWERAKFILRDLASVREPAPRHLAYYVQTLIEHKEIEVAKKEIDRLEALELERGSEPNAFAAVELRARLLEEEPGTGDKAIRLLENHIRRPKANPDEVLLVLNSMRRQKKFALAYQRCLQTWDEKKCSPEVIGGASVAILRGMQANGAPANHDQILRIETYLNNALAEKPKSVVLMLHMAELYDHRGRWEQAEEMYRRVLAPENEPKNIVALNNLAWLLAQRSSDEAKIQEALVRIEAAVSGIGKRADLIDTRGLVYMKMGQDAAALNDFREAAADAPSPAHLFHLARAHYKTSDRTSAIKILKQAQEQGLQASLLHPSEQDVYQKMVNDLKIR